MNAIGTKTLNTPRLTLRKIQPEDAQSLFSCGILGGSLSEAEELVSNMIESGGDPMTFHWALEYEGRAVGRIKGWDVNPRNNFIQLGYDIGSLYRNKGLMTEAVKTVCKYLLGECDLNRVYCMVRESNPASLRVCEKSGMTHEGCLRNHWIDPDGTYVNVHVWGILRSEI